MNPELAINLGLALIGLVALLLIFILKELRNLSSILEHSEVPAVSKATEAYLPSTAGGVPEAEVAAIVAILAKIMPDKKIASIRVEG